MTVSHDTRLLRDALRRQTSIGSMADSPGKPQYARNWDQLRWHLTRCANRDFRLGGSSDIANEIWHLTQNVLDQNRYPLDLQYNLTWLCEESSKRTRELERIRAAVSR